MPDQQRQARILIIDNDDGLTRAMAIRLEALGYECTTARTGAEGLHEFSVTPADLVITDLNMPATNGVETARALREMTEVPIIFVTGYRRNFRRDLRGLRNISILDKPFDFGDLEDFVESALIGLNV